MSDAMETDWKPIATAPCDDRFAWVRWQGGKEEMTDFDHDSDPEWWAERGATHWRDATEEEREDFYSRLVRMQDAG